MVESQVDLVVVVKEQEDSLRVKMVNKEVARVERGQVRLAALQLGNKVRVASI